MPTGLAAEFNSYYESLTQSEQKLLALEISGLFIGSSTNDSLQVQLEKAYIFGKAGTDSLYGGERDDVLNGGDGCDYLSGAGGNDGSLGEIGNDAHSGGLGDDFYEG
ncbi:hypothetical protein EWW49_31425, partial [Pseudomonas syringae]